MTLTKRQKEILEFLRDYAARHGYAPTLNEIGRRFELSSLATVHKHLKNLEHKRYIRRKWNRSRAVEIVSPPRRRSNVVELPLLGTVAIAAVDQFDPSPGDRASLNLLPQVTGLGISNVVDNASPVLGGLVTLTATATNGGPGCYIQFGPWDRKGYKGDFLTIRELRGGELRFDGYHRPQHPSNSMDRQETK